MRAMLVTRSIASFYASTVLSFAMIAYFFSEINQRSGRERNF